MLNSTEYHNDHASTACAVANSAQNGTGNEDALRDFETFTYETITKMATFWSDAILDGLDNDAVARLCSYSGKEYDNPYRVRDFLYNQVVFGKRKVAQSNGVITSLGYAIMKEKKVAQSEGDDVKLIEMIEDMGHRKHQLALDEAYDRGASKAYLDMVGEPWVKAEFKHSKVRHISKATEDADKLLDELGFNKPKDSSN